MNNPEFNLSRGNGRSTGYNFMGDYYKLHRAKGSHRIFLFELYSAIRVFTSFRTSVAGKGLST